MSVLKKIFVIDDEPGMLRYMTTMLELEGVQVRTAADPLDALQTLKSGYAPDLIFLDLLMPNLDGIQALAEILKIDRRHRVVILSCISDTAKVVEAMRVGALDYVTKPFQQEAINTVITRYCSNEVGEDLGSCEVTELADNAFFLTGSDEMRRIRAEVELIAKVDIPVLILGESGVGKEVIAQLIRERSERASKPYIKINCAALPGDLLESELFGYEAGAFTGANKAKVGKFELCDGGILFLDEIGELPVYLQAKLLHVLQDGEFSRLGGRSSKRVNVRVIAATNIDVQRSIANKTFREDLYYRLAAFSITIPVLRARKQEIPMLLKHMMQRTAESYGRPAVEFTPALSEACAAYDWPGNVRELSNFVKRLLVLRDESAALDELMVAQRKSAAAVVASASVASVAIDQRRSEANAIMQAIQQFNGNKRLAASSLKMSYNVFLQKEKEYNIRPKRSAESR
jgi:two-component system, NtrC family, response regulator AtoC